MSGLKSSTALGAVLAAALAATVLSGPASADLLKVGLREFSGGKGNPYSGAIGTPGLFSWSAIFEQLTKNGEGGVSEPFLATGWKNMDPNTWRFTLRPNVKFSNGEDFNAAAVKAAYDWLLKTDAGKLQATGKTTGPFIDDVIVVDNLTVDFKTKRPNPIFSKTVQAVTIVPPKAWSERGLETFTLNPIASGPYTLEFKADQALAGPNQTSWKTRADVDRIQFIELPEGPARAQALLSSQIDVDILLSRDAMAQTTAAGMKIYAKPSTRTIGISFVSHRNKKPAEGPMADVRVRQAINYAVDKESIVKNVYQGAGRPASQAAASTIRGFNPNLKPYEYDPEKAKKLLSEAGYPNGIDMEIRAITTDTAISLVYQAALQDLNKVGVRAKLISQPFSDWIKYWLAGDWPYEAFGFGHDLTTTLDASQAFTQLTSCMKPDPYYCNQAEMPLITQAEGEFDEAKRLALWGEVLKINRDNAPILFLIEFDETMGYNPKIQNFSHTNLWIPYNELKLTRR